MSHEYRREKRSFLRPKRRQLPRDGDILAGLRMGQDWEAEARWQEQDSRSLRKLPGRGRCVWRRSEPCLAKESVRSVMRQVGEKAEKELELGFWTGLFWVQGAERHSSSL